MTIVQASSDAMRTTSTGVREAQMAARLRLSAAPSAIKSVTNITTSRLDQPDETIEIGFQQRPQPQHNLLLSTLSDETRQRVFPDLELVYFESGKMLFETNDAWRYVYFPTDSIVSLLAIMENGASAEISLIGSEGVIGISSVMGGDQTPRKAVVLQAGYAYRLPAEHLREECNRRSQTLELMLRYTQALLVQMAQAAACNRHHSINQQLCRWLLLALDRLPTNRMTMTQEQIASLLGVRREGITSAAGKLQKMGVIKYFRGQIVVLDRSKLEEMSCECYSIVKRETDRLLPKLLPPARTIRVVQRTASNGNK